ncbi:separase isoform X1 [Typha angustifolia]|uniref:separase isoform X1 n=1 Tax=Typha angustifolia TaxID=59011 RepID=UPI003C2C43EC
MDSIASSLLESLRASDHRGLSDRFVSFLLPFSDLLLHSKKSTLKQKPTSKAKKSDPDPDPDPSTSLRPLAKQFLPFLCQALHLLPSILRKTSKDDQDSATELFRIYRHLLECLACISPCLAGKPYSVHLQRGRFVCCLETGGKYSEAEAEAISLLESLRTVLGKSQKRRRNADVGIMLPDPKVVGVEDSEITTLALEVVISLASCAVKSETRNGAAYERILVLVEQVHPWLRFLDTEMLKKYHSLLVNALYRCSVFLATECISFNGDLVQRFCIMMLKECAKSSSEDRFPIIARKICSSVDLHWEGRGALMLDVVKLILKSMLCECKGHLSKGVNEFLEFVSYCADCFHAANIDICRCASEFFYEQGSSFNQVSPAVASILLLYATGLNFNSGNIQVRQSEDSHQVYSDSSIVTFLLDNVETLQRLTSSLLYLKSHFHTGRNQHECLFDCAVEDSGIVSKALAKSNKTKICDHLRGNASFISYIDALEFLCKMLLSYVNLAWKQWSSEKKAFHHSAKMEHIFNALHQFCDSTIAAFRCVRTSSERERLYERRRTLLEAAVSALKISFLTSGCCQKSLSSINYVISNEWVEPQELRFLISALSNIGAVMYNIGHFEQAPVALELCCQAIWQNIKLIFCRSSTKLSGNSITDISKDAVKDAVSDALTRITMIVDTLHRCCAKTIQEIVIKSLFEISAVDNTFVSSSGSFVLIKQWVKIICKDFEGVEMVDDVPMLYSSLSSYRPSWPEKIVGKILEQELLAYGLMEARNPILSKKMQLKIIAILLNDLYVSKDYKLEKSRVLIRKARALRACGLDGLSSSLECLSEAISLLKDVSLDASGSHASIYHHLAIAYCLNAQCAQEASLDSKVILQNVRCALNLWLSLDIQGDCATNGRFELTAVTMIPLLCSIVDLLFLKGCSEFQFDIFKLMIMIWKRENIPLEKCFAMLWSDRRLNHSLCTFPIDKQLIFDISKQLGINANSTDFWISCIKGHPPSLCMFLQKVSLTDCIFREVSEHSFERSLGWKVSIDEVRKVVSSLISDVPLASRSAYVAGYLYYDLSEKLLSKGRLSEALSYAREALKFRKKLLRRKFIYSFQQQKCVDSGKETLTRHDLFCLEALGSVITETWPDFSRSGILEDSFLTPWTVLRCYLESILQVGIIHESTGNGAEAEVLFRTGKDISYLQGLPIFGITFGSLLGELYCKKQSWDIAENELKCARKLLEENDMIISCKHCKLTLEVTIDMQIGDLSRNLFEKGFQTESTNSLSQALGMYRSALKKLNHADFDCSLSIYNKPEVNMHLVDEEHRVAAKHEGINGGRRSYLVKEVRSTICNNCVAIDKFSSFSHARHLQSEYDQKSCFSAEGGGLLENVQVRRKTRNASKIILKEKSLEVEAKTTRTRSTNRLSRKKCENIETKVDHKYENPTSDEFCADSLSLRKLKATCKTSSIDIIRCNIKGISAKEGCWSCLLIKVLNDGSMQDITFLRWECYRRRLLLILLLKIAKSLGAHGGKHGAHEVHDLYWQCIFLLFCGSIPQTYSEVPGSNLIALILDENSGDVLSVERATILYNMSFFSLKGCFSEQLRGECCSLSNVRMSEVVPWLLRAFILSQEIPALLQKICRLLSSIFLLSAMDCSISLPLYSENSLSLNHWAAYFHQASLGTSLHCHYLSDVREVCNPESSKGHPSDTITETDNGPSIFLRFLSGKLEHLEQHVIDFFQSLPNVPIICISMLGGDYVNLLGETLLLPSFFPAWVLVSRMDSTSQPIAMLLPVDLILEDLQLEDANFSKELLTSNSLSVKSWQCPWGCTIVDSVAPSFKQLLEENFLSLSNTTFTPADGQANHIKWWSQRTKLNNRLDKLLKNIEESWLGPWGCLLLGRQLVHKHMDIVLPKLINDLKSQFKFDVNQSIVKAILGGAKSVADAEACISQLVLYKGYFGRGACCGMERFRAFSAACQIGPDIPESILSLLQEAIVEQSEPIDREPVILVLDTDVQMLPWENLPMLRCQEIYRMPSVGSIFFTFDKNLCHKKERYAFGAHFPIVNPFNTYYLLNPSGDLNSTQVEFEQWFRNQNWKGKAGDAPTTEELVSALQNHDMFLYFGHGSGTQYISGNEIEKVDQCAATLLMGCSSGSLLCKGCYAPQGVPLSYLFAGSPAVVANLWDVTDKDIDRFGKAMLNSWLQEELADQDNCSNSCRLAKEFGCMSVDNEGNANFLKTRRKPYRGKKLQESCENNRCHYCGSKRIASRMSQARDACKLPLLIGASPVCYGVPTIVRKKLQL